jgi:predicted PurR-regulated permease PerM
MKDRSGRIRLAGASSKENTFDAPAESPGVWLLMVITGIVLYLCWIMVAPFLSAVTWAFALCVVMNPVRRRMISRWSSTSVATVMLVFVVAIIAVSLYVMSQRLIQEALKTQQVLQGFLQPGVWDRLRQSGTWMGSVWSWAKSQIDLEAIVKEASTTVARSLAPAFGKSAVGISRAFLSLLFFFFFVRDQKRLIEGVRRLLPLTPSESEQLFDRTTATVQATVVGRIGIGTIQGAIGGILFLLVGIPAPLFWSIVMAVFSMLPVFGAFVVWIPAAAILLVSGHWIRALILVAGGVALIHPVDNIVYPLLVGPRVGLHPLVLLVAFLGGVIVFGPPGLILGPIIVTVAMVLAEIWHARTSESRTEPLGTPTNLP